MRAKNLIEPFPRFAPLVGLLLAADMASAADPSDDVFDLDNLRVKITESLPYLQIRDGTEEVRIMRHQDLEHTVEPPYDQTSRDCPPFCIQPMILAPGVETIGELELLGYLDRIDKGDADVLVVDSRTPEWIVNGAIPGAVNIPYTRLDPQYADAKGIADVLEVDFGVTRLDGLWNFSTAKTLVLYCNGAWCGQSPTNIKALLAIGYPAHKLKWYRGGMQAWEQLGFTTVKSER
jgi:rhodanese-related sulfurtransferase